MAGLEENFGIPNARIEGDGVSNVEKVASIETVLAERNRLEDILNEASRVASVALKNGDINPDSDEHSRVMDFLDREADEATEVIYSGKDENEILKTLEEITERVDVSTRSDSQSGLDKLRELLARDESRRDDLEIMRSDERVMGAKGRDGRRASL